MDYRRRILSIIVLLVAAATGLGAFDCAFHPDQQDVPVPNQLPRGVEEVYIPTWDQERIQCYWLPQPASPWVLIYFSSNSGNIGHRIPDLLRLSAMGLNVMGAGYRGFGKSTGWPSEGGLYRDGRAILDEVVEARGFDRTRVILMGYSLGTTVALEVARGEPLGGLILIMPLTTAQEVARVHGYGPLSYFVADAFDNLRKIDEIRSPLLIVHGSDDIDVPLGMGRRIYAAAPEPKRLVIIKGATHADISKYAPDQYWGAIREYISALKTGQIPVGITP